MSTDPSGAYIVEVRAEAAAALARLATVDPDALPPDLGAIFDESRQRWERMRRLTEDDVVTLHVAACG